MAGCGALQARRRAERLEGNKEREHEDSEHACRGSSRTIEHVEYLKDACGRPGRRGDAPGLARPRDSTTSMATARWSRAEEHVQQWSRPPECPAHAHGRNDGAIMRTAKLGKAGGGQGQQKLTMESGGEKPMEGTRRAANERDGARGGTPRSHRMAEARPPARPHARRDGECVALQTRHSFPNPAPSPARSLPC